MYILASIFCSGTKFWVDTKTNRWQKRTLFTVYYTWILSKDASLLWEGYLLCILLLNILCHKNRCIILCLTSPPFSAKNDLLQRFATVPLISLDVNRMLCTHMTCVFKGRQGYKLTSDGKTCKSIIYDTFNHHKW